MDDELTQNLGWHQC